MIDADWERLASLIGNWWPGEWTRERDEAYRMALDGFAPADVLRAFEVHLRAGERFRPSAAEVVATILGSTGTASPGHALELVEQACRRVNRSVYAADFHDRHQAALDWLAEQDPAVAWWAATRGICQVPGAICQEPINDPERGGIVRASLGKEFVDVAARVRERITLGQPAVPAGALTYRGSTAPRDGGMREVVAALRPAEQLPVGKETS